MRASYLGVDLSRAWWFRDGFYASTSMELRYYDFGQWQDATRIIPEDRGRLRAAFKLGVWRSELRAHVLGVSILTATIGAGGRKVGLVFRKVKVLA